MFKKIVASLCLGLCITLWIVQDDPWVKQLVGTLFIDKFTAALECKLTGTVKRINFFWPSIELENVVVEPITDEQWRWHAKKFTTRFTWRSLLIDGIIDLHIWFNQLSATSHFENGKLALASFIERAVSGASLSLPTFLKEVRISGGTCNVYEAKSNVQARVVFSGDAKKIDKSLRATMCLEDGAIIANDVTYVSDINGMLHVDAENSHKGALFSFTSSGAVQLAHLPHIDKHCFFSINWDRDHGTASLKNANRTFVVGPVRLSTIDDRIVGAFTAQLPLSYVAHIAKIPCAQEKVRGTCIAQLLLNISDVNNGVDGNITITGAHYGESHLCEWAKLSFSRNNECWKGGLRAHSGAAYRLGGSWHYNQESKRGSAHLENSSNLQNWLFRYWSILPQDAQINISFHDQKLKCLYQCMATNTMIDTTTHIGGTLVVKDKKIIVDGTCGDKRYKACAQLKPFCLERIEYGNEKKEPSIVFNKHATHSQALNGSIHFSFIRDLIRHITGYDVTGDGIISTSALAKDATHYAGKISLNQGTIRLPHTYNLVKGFDAIIAGDWLQKKIIVRDVALQLHRGFIACQRASLLFDDQLNLLFAHVPLVFDSCLLNLKRDLFALISGSLLLQKTAHESPLLKGTILLERAQLKENLFSDALFKQLMEQSPHVQTDHTSGMAYDLVVQTKDSINVHTPFLQTQARLNMHITGTKREPKLNGILLLSGGTLNFPYKPLYITKGSITFVPDNLDDPLVELVAQNKVRNYQVNLHVTGSRSNPTILLRSTPPLSQEQCIALLFTGAPEESLNIVMPALLMQNIKSMLFESQEPSLAPNSYFASLLKPLERIHILPRFSDQTGRGGIRGAIEIELGQRWRALIQQNFSLTEDTRFELEYLASDNISVRTFRDERRDVGGEVEMRWKW